MDFSTQSKNQEAYDLMTAHACAVLATLSENNAPEMAHVIVHIDERFNVYFVSRKTTRKVSNIAARSIATLFFSDVETMRQAEYAGEGRVVENMQEIAGTLPMIQKAIADSQSSYKLPPVSQMEEEGYVLICIAPTSIRYRDYSHSNEHPTPTEHDVQLHS